MKTGHVKTRIVRIGNSHGIRIPRAVLEQTGLKDHVEIAVRKDSLIIRPVGHPREGWAEAFKAMASNDDVECNEVVNSWDDTEWQW
ncbi:MAG: hypothetical protein WD768_22785 [Phycisphaeraceae bacterium]